MNSTLQSKKLIGRKYRSVLVIPDQHFPYEHPDTIRFLAALKSKLRPDLVVNLGDEVDGHAISFHEKDPDLAGAKDELERAIEKMQPLYRLFPEMEILDSNHGSLLFRQAMAAGLPSQVLRGVREVLKAPRGWHWSQDLTINTALGLVFFHHGKTSQSGKLSKNMAMNTVQGHFHSKFQIDYWASPRGLYWDMHSGSLVDDTSRAMAYNKVTMQRPIVGASSVVQGQPQLHPMVLKPNGRWTGVL